MRHCQPCPSLLSLPKSPCPRGELLSGLSLLCSGHRIDAISACWGHQLPWAVLSQAHCGPTSQHRLVLMPGEVPDVWGCPVPPCFWLGWCGELPALPCCSWGALTRTSKLLLMTETQVERIHVFIQYLFGNARSWKQFNMQWSQWKTTSIILLEYQGYILLVQTRPGNKCHFLTKPLEHPWSQRSTKTWVKTI